MKNANDPRILVNGEVVGTNEKGTHLAFRFYSELDDRMLIRYVLKENVKLAE